MATFTITAVDTEKDTITVVFDVDKTTQTFHGIANSPADQVLAYIAQTAKDYAESVTAPKEAPGAELRKLIGVTLKPEDIIPAVADLEATQAETAL